MNSNSLRTIRQENFSGERALFQAKNLHLDGCTFLDGESPLKHSANITAENCLFKWKYPFWYSCGISLKNCTLFEMARAGIWYSENISIEDTLVEAPKELRRCKGVSLKNVSVPNAAETLWNCSNITIENVTAKGDYFGMGCENVRIDGLTLYGNYCFDGARNVEVHNSRFLSKDCFWNADNITIYDSFISGEYLAWNSRNITLVNCTIESLQGMCYIENLVMRSCRLLNTTLAFEYSSVDADICGRIDSVLNPSSGTVRAEQIGELILEKDKVDVSKTKIIVRNTADGCHKEAC